MKNIYKKIISTVLSISILSMSFFAVPTQKTEAIDLGGVIRGVATGYAICWATGTVQSYLSQVMDILAVPTGSIGGKTITATSAAKECGFDYAANQLKQELISGILKSTTEWVKGGYKGKPAFMTNPDQFLEEATDQFLANIIENNEATSVLCDSFRTPLKFAVNLNFYKKDDVNIPSCTMSDIEQNIDNALGDLKNFYNTDGSLDSGNYWNSFIRTNTTSGGNAYESYIQVSDDLKKKIGEQNNKKLRDVQVNNGYMSVERCDDENDGTYAGDASNRICGGELTSCLSTADTDIKKKNCNSKAARCIENSVGKRNCEYVTPGKVISDEVTSVLGMERENLQMADEFDELIAAIITQMMSKVFDSNQGLSGINRSGDGKDYESSVEKDISVEKSSMLKQYSPRSYDIQLKIYQSLLDAIEPAGLNFNPLDIVKEEELYWKGKDDSILGTERRLARYWESAGQEVSLSSDWNGAFISYITNGDISMSYKKDGSIKGVSGTKYIKGEAQILEGSVVCNFKNTKNVYCDIVTAVNGSNATTLGAKPTGKGNTRTLGVGSIVIGSDKGLADKENMVIFTAPKTNTGDKYNGEYYKKLFGDEYSGGVGNGLSGYDKNALPRALEKWKEYKKEFEKAEGDRKIYAIWGTGSGPFSSNENYGLSMTLDAVDGVIQAFENGGTGIDEEEVKVIKKLRDDTIRDREEAYRVSGEIKKASKIQDLWEIGGNNAKADLSKAYKIYKSVSKKLGTGVMGVPALAEGEPGHKGGLAAYAVHIEFLSEPIRQKSKNEIDNLNAINSGPPSKPGQQYIHIYTPPIDFNAMKDWAAEDEKIEKLGIKEFEIEYDPIDDIRNLDSGLYDEDNYSYEEL